MISGTLSALSPFLFGVFHFTFRILHLCCVIEFLGSLNSVRIWFAVLLAI